MSDARWLELENDSRAVTRYFSLAIQLHEDDIFYAEGLRAQQAEMALMHAMQSGYTSLESAIVRILAMFGEDQPVGQEWHRDLIKRAAISVGKRPAILDGELLASAQEARKFRHRAMHNYDDFDPLLAGPSIEAARILSERFEATVAAFRQAVDP